MHVPGPQVHYTFNKVLMLQEPLLVVAAFYILFFTVIVYVRLDFSTTKVPACHHSHRQYLSNFISSLSGLPDLFCKHRQFNSYFLLFINSNNSIYHIFYFIFHLTDIS